MAHLLSPCFALLLLLKVFALSMPYGLYSSILVYPAVFALLEKVVDFTDAPPTEPCGHGPRPP